MSDFNEKILWSVLMRNDAEEQRLLAHAKAAGATGVAIRTSNSRLPAAIPRFRAEKLKVYAWRWPACRPGSTLSHYYAPDQAAYVAGTLIPAGLAGYFADIESDNDGGLNDWDDTQFKPLAIQFCAVIRAAAPLDFVLALTAGAPQPFNNPNIPWSPFVQASDYLLPQTYWRIDKNGAPTDINGGTPAKAIQTGDQCWSPIAAGKKLVPMIGELALVTTAEIAAFGAAMIARNERLLHIYCDDPAVTPQQLQALAAL